MSNLFKSNSRFAALAEDIEKPIKKEEKKPEKIIEKRPEKREETKEENKKSFIFKENSFLKEEPNYFKRDYQRRDNNYDSRYESKEHKDERIKRENLKKEEEKRKKAEELQKNLEEINFPDLSNKIITNNNKKKIISYSEKAAKAIQKEEDQVIEQVIEQVVENTIKPGWVEIKRDINNPRKLIYTYGAVVSEEDTIETSYDKSHNSVFEGLVNLHKRRTQEYIDMWGYDAWEKMFRSPNYDYEYFDKLDAEYEMEEENDIEYEYN